MSIAVAAVAALPATECVVCGARARWQVGPNRGNRSCSPHVGDLLETAYEDSDGFAPPLVTPIGGRRA